MNKNTQTTAWETLTREEKKQRLLLRQRAVLETFLARGAISRAQYEQGLAVLAAGREGPAWTR